MQNTTTTDAPAASPNSNPRELEADLLLKAATRLESVQNSWDTRKTELDDALLFNRQLWTDVLTSVMDADHSLPADIRQSIANLGQFVMHQTLSVLSDPRPERLNALISINYELADGLLGRA